MEKNKNKYILYIVKEGDTIESIAEQYNTTVKSIMKINNLDSNSFIYAGMNLYIKKKRIVIVPIWILFLAILALISGTSYLTFMVFRNSNYLYPNGGGFNIGGKNGNKVIKNDVGTVIFSFNEGDNIIDIPNAYPLVDAAGKAQKGEGEYFQFSISFKFDKEKRDATYEINLEQIEVLENPLDSKYVKVYLEENTNPVVGYEDDVLTFDKLKNSTIRPGSKVLYSKSINDDSNNDYILKLWVSDKYAVDETPRTFKCKINVDGYVK